LKVGAKLLIPFNFQYIENAFEKWQMEPKKILYIDMDNVLVDYKSGIDFLVDDRPKNGAKDFTGEWIQFGTGKYPDWDTVLEYLKQRY
jgi:hypothetical protein